MPSSTWCEVAPFLTAIGGYYFARILSRDSADRKEDRDLIEKIISDIEIVETYSYKFYSLPPDDAESKSLHLQINRLLKQIGRETHSLSIRYCDNSISKFQLTLKQKITLNDFESIDRQAREPTDQLFNEISDCSRRLIGEMELAFRKKYRKNN